jgi:hypothetical protein
VKRRDRFGDTGVDGTIILKHIFHKKLLRVWAGCIWLRIGPVVGSCKHGNGISGSIKGGKFLDQVSDS